MEPTLHAAERCRGDVGDLFVAETLGVPEDEDHPVLGGEASQLPLEALDPLTDLEALGGEALWFRLGFVECLGVHRLGASAGQVVKGGVVRDTQQPRTEGGVAAEVPQPMEGPQEGVLAHVFGVLRPDDARRYANHDVAMELDELLEGAQISLRGETHESGVSGQRRIDGRVRAHDRPDGQGAVRVTPIRTL